MSTFRLLPSPGKVKSSKLAIIAMACCLVYGQGYAEEISSNASVNLLFGLTLTEDRELDFGSLSGEIAANCSINNVGSLNGTATGCRTTLGNRFPSRSSWNLNGQRRCALHHRQVGKNVQISPRTELKSTQRTFRALTRT